MNDTSQARFSGYAIVEILGHQQVAGFVTTEYFGSVAMLHVQLPPIDDVEQTITERTWIGGEYLEPGSKIRVTVARVEQWVGAQSVYRLTACDEATVLARQPRSVEVLERAARAQLPAPVAVGPSAPDFDVGDDVEDDDYNRFDEDDEG